MTDWELDTEATGSTDSLSDLLVAVEALSESSISAMIVHLQDLQRKRRLDDGDIGERIRSHYDSAFSKRGLCALPWIEEGVLWCPGEIIESSKSSHVCQFVSLGRDVGWVYESDLMLGEKIWYQDKGGQRSITALQYHDGLEISVVECKASMGNHAVQKSRNYKVVGDDLEYVGQSEGRGNSRGGGHR